MLVKASHARTRENFISQLWHNGINSSSSSSNNTEMRAVPYCCSPLLLLPLPLAILFKFSDSSLARVCREFEKNTKHEFYPLRHCQRSNKTVIAYGDVDGVEQCAAIARDSKALAFNYSPKGRRRKNLFETVTGNRTKSDFYSCEALACSEHRNFSTVVNDTRFDYYSMYTRPAPMENATCIESLGMFVHYKERRNYSTAIATCTSINGQLAHIATERRTNALSVLLQQNSLPPSKDAVAFVGLNETTRGRFITSNAEPLECFDYRAFSPGHPPEIRKPSCIVITKRSAWKTTVCTRRFEFICELLASGPSPYVNNLHQTCSTKRPNNRFSPGGNRHDSH